MNIERVCVLGGSGFVGRSVCDDLVKLGKSVRVLTRRRDNAKALFVLPSIEIVEADVHDQSALAAQFQDEHAVINLTGVLHDRPRGEFERVHVDLPRKVAEACRQAGVSRLIHMSALGASDVGPSGYLRSRGRGEMIATSMMNTIATTVFRPSVIFGPDDNFINLFAGLVRVFPVIPLGGAKARFQPVYVQDVARCVAASLDNPATFGRTYELGGPKVYTLREIIAFIVALMRKRRLVIPLPAPLAYLQALALEFAPGGPVMTRDNLASMSVDNVCASAWPSVFDFEPAAMETIVPQYLARDSSRGRYDLFRYKAGR